VIGIVPAAGYGKRLQPLPCSKEILPVGFEPARDGQAPRPKVALHYLLERMRSGGAAEAFIVLRAGKWDIPSYFRDGGIAGMQLGYLIARVPYGVPYTLDQAHPFVRDALVLVGMPDLLFEPEDAFLRLRRRQAETGADVVLGLFRANRLGIIDMVEADQSGRVQTVVPKPGAAASDLGWLIAVWTPAFTEYLHAFVARDEAARDGSGSGREVSVAHVLDAGLGDGLLVQSVTFRGSSFADIGSPRGLRRALKRGWPSSSRGTPATPPDMPAHGAEPLRPLEEAQRL
jgi:glucose-1-phosphate thymidylyltransferase